MKAYYEELAMRGFGETGDQSVCLDCIIDEVLRDQIAPHLTEDVCTFCGRETEDGAPIAAPFEELMRSIMDAICFFYERSEENLFWMDDITKTYTSQEVAYDVSAGEVADNVLDEIFDVIADDLWNKDPSRLPPNVAWRYGWDAFREKVKHEARFVFLSIPEESSSDPDEFTASEILAKLVNIIQFRGIIANIPTGRVFYRGRMVDKPDTSGFDASTLGSPPPLKASANRMSPAGISMFYGCDDVATVVAEIGSHTIKRFAVIGAFETTRPMQMVNLASLPPIPSVFDLEQRKHYHELVFLHGFARDLSASIALDGREHIEYVPTQVVTEYMRWLPDVAIDGILFASAQNGGISGVIFCGPEGCADAGKETAKTMLRLKADSVQTVRVVASAAAL